MLLDAFPVLGRVLSCLAETRKWGLRNNIKVIVVLIFSLITQSITVSEAQSFDVSGVWTGGKSVRKHSKKACQNFVQRINA